MDINGIFHHVSSKIRAKIILSLKVILGCDRCVSYNM